MGELGRMVLEHSSSGSVYGGDGEKNLWGRGNKPGPLIQPLPTPFLSKLRALGMFFLRRSDLLTDLNILLDSGSQTVVIILSYSLHKNGKLGFAGHSPSNSNFDLVLCIQFQFKVLKSVLQSSGILLGMVLNVAKCLQLERRAKGSLQTKAIIS